jgi:hypothetical protein
VTADNGDRDKNEVLHCRGPPHILQSKSCMTEYYFCFVFVSTAARGRSPPRAGKRSRIRAARQWPFGDSGWTAHRAWHFVFQVQVLPFGQTIAPHGSPHADCDGGSSGSRQPASAAAMTNAKSARFMDTNDSRVLREMLAHKKGARRKARTPHPDLLPARAGRRRSDCSVEA